MTTKGTISALTDRLTRLLTHADRPSIIRLVRRPEKTTQRSSCVLTVSRDSRPTWAEISLQNLKANFRTLRGYVGPHVQVCAVVKADAYRHGLIECATALQEEGAEWFGVTSTQEGTMLRRAGIRGRILLFTGFWRGDEDEIIAQRLTPSVWESWHLESLQRATRGRRNSSLAVHLKIDTGMARLGVQLSDLPATASYLRTHSEILLEGIFTHLASAENVGAPEVDAQLARFQEAVNIVRRSGLAPQYLHAANSAAIVTRSDSWHNMVRPGISLYGYYLPFAGSHECRPPTVTPVLSWKTRVISLRRLTSGQPIGYNGTYTTKRESRIAVLPVGYADGLNRHLSSGGRVLIHGGYVPIVGRISMDLTMIDVSDVPGVAIGDEVILLGSSGPHSITASDHADVASTIPYEILCNISKRVPRHFTNDSTQ